MAVVVTWAMACRAHCRLIGRMERLVRAIAMQYTLGEAHRAASTSGGPQGLSCQNPSDTLAANLETAMRELYAWVPWFNELARKIANGNELELAERASNIRWREHDNSSPLLNYGRHNVDPLSFIYTLATHCRGPDGELASSIASLPSSTSKPNSLWVSTMPSTSPGTPQNTLFHQRGEGNPGLLWDLFRHSVVGLDAVPGQDFGKALRIGNVGAAKLTQALFLIDGRAFMPYDNSTRRLLPGSFPPTPDWGRYRAAVDELRAQFPGCEPYEINLFAYLVHAKKLHVGSGVFQVSTNVRGDEVDHWDDFERNCWVYTGGLASGVGFDRDDHAALDKRYPLDAPDRGDLVMVRTGGEGKALAVVWRNDYRRELTAETRLHVLWLNKLQAPLGFTQSPGFSRAHEIENAFRRRDEYRPTFAVLDLLRSSNGLTKAAVLATLEEYDRLGREGFLQHYSYASARTRWIRHGATGTT